MLLPPVLRTRVHCPWPDPGPSFAPRHPAGKHPARPQDDGATELPEQAPEPGTSAADVEQRVKLERFRNKLQEDVDRAKREGKVYVLTHFGSNEPRETGEAQSGGQAADCRQHSQRDCWRRPMLTCPPAPKPLRSRADADVSPWGAAEARPPRDCRL